MVTESRDRRLKEVGMNIISSFKRRAEMVPVVFLENLRLRVVCRPSLPQISWGLPPNPGEI